MAKRIFQASAIIEQVSTRRDNTIKLSVGVQDLDPESETMLMRLRNKVGWFVFSESTIDKQDLASIPEEVKIDKGEKSASQRLRSRMFVYFTEYLRKDKNDFNLWRDRQLELLGQRYLDKLDN